MPAPAKQIGITLALFLQCTWALAHDFWIEPDQFMPAPGAQVNVTLREGEAYKGNSLPYIPEWFNDFSQTAAEGGTPVVAMLGNDPAAAITVDEGALLLGYQSNPNFVVLEAKKFNEYLQDEGLEFLREQRRAKGEDEAPARELYVRCAKTLLQAGSDGGDIYKTRLNYALELIPQADPYAQQTGDKLAFQVLRAGEPIEGLLVQAFTRNDTDSVQKVRTDSDGMATITLDRGGDWFVKVVSIEAIANNPQADWISFWATYLFTMDPLAAQDAS